jgi:glycerophosphoryl diester phosphodiesterase
MQCARTYLLTGWYGNVGAACRNTIIFVPSNFGWVAWGWPDLFLQRMQDAGSDVYIAGPLRRGERPGVVGLDDAESLSRIPRGWRGGLTTDRIEIIGPLVSRGTS